jgi:Pentapeptide repeats (8 copies)
MLLFDLTAERERLRLTPDCANCFGLCCVAHGFKASPSFAIDKQPGVPCPNLQTDFGCTIYSTLRPNGFAGCTAYTCFGAGQRISQEMFGRTDWREAPETAGLMFQTLPIVRQLNELLWFVTEALARCAPGPEYPELLGLLRETERMAALQPNEMSWGEVDHHCQIGESLLSRVSVAIRAAELPVMPDGPALTASVELPEGVRRGADLHGAYLRGADLSGADLLHADLRSADLWGAVLVNADISGADLRYADLMGTNLGRANLTGANLTGAIFLTQGQLELADGSPRTILPAPLQIPAHWSEADPDAIGHPDDRNP